MSRTPIMAGNWKMNKTTGEAVVLSQDISYGFPRRFSGNVEIVLCPPFIDLKSVANVLEFDNAPILLGAQNVHWEPDGAYTGEVSVRMLAEVGVKYCIVGHSERREYFGETDETVNKKAKALIAGGIHPIICVGESLDCREAGNTNSFVEAQVRAAIDGIAPADLAKSVIAYEPIWAIGTGRVPTPEAADEVCGLIRATVADVAGKETADAIRILYGGSMKPENAGMFLPMENIDGGLIGGAALKADSFVKLVEATL